VLFVDASSLISKYVYDRADFFSAYMFFALGMGVGGLLYLLIKLSDNKSELRNIRRKIRFLLPVFVIAELTAVAAEVTLNASISKGPVSLVKVVEGVQPVFVLLFALLLYPIAPKFFREIGQGSINKKLGLMAVMIAGLALINAAN
jgi:drug/metabolite transporter (DMT)-like permease